MKALVTGVGGFIGSHLARHFLSQGHTVVGLTRTASRRSEERIRDLRVEERFHLLVGDLTGDISGLCERTNAVFHLAGRTFVDHSIQDPASFLRNNVLGTFNLLEDARRYEPEVFLQISTDEVYGPIGIEEGNFDENAPLMPSNPYAASKASADMFVLSYFKTYELPGVVVRTSNVYGTYQHSQKAIPTFTREALAGRELPVYGDGRHRRTWLSVEDFCHALEILSARGVPGQVYHAAGDDEIENLELARLVLRILKRSEDMIRFIPEMDVRPGHDRRYSLDSNKLRQLEWRPQDRLDVKLPRTVDWYSKNAWWLES